MKIIAFGHQKRVGKDTCARFVATQLRLEYGMRNVQKKGFADEVKVQCYTLFAWAGLQPGHYYEEQENMHKREEVLPLIGLTPRQLWIGHGMACRTYYENIWVDYLLKGTKADFLIVSDLRFPNEAASIQALGGSVVKITRPEIPHTSDAADDPLLTYNGWDHHIINDGTQCQLMEKVDSLLKYIMTEPVK